MGTETASCEQWKHIIRSVRSRSVKSHATPGEPRERSSGHVMSVLGLGGFENRSCAANLPEPDTHGREDPASASEATESLLLLRAAAQAWRARYAKICGCRGDAMARALTCARLPGPLQRGQMHRRQRQRAPGRDGNAMLDTIIRKPTDTNAV